MQSSVTEIARDTYRISTFHPDYGIHLLLAAPALAANSHKGKVVEAGAGKLTMTDMAGKNQHTHEVPADATILCNGNKCGLEDLKAGETVKVTLGKKGDQTVVTKISARKVKTEAKKAGQ